MIYRDFQGMQLSALGFGAMRLPIIDGNDSRIPEVLADFSEKLGSFGR